MAKMVVGKNELCKKCGKDCWQFENVALVQCSGTKENSEINKLANKLYKEYTTVR